MFNHFFGITWVGSRSPCQEDVKVGDFTFFSTWDGSEMFNAAHVSYCFAL